MRHSEITALDIYIPITVTFSKGIYTITQSFKATHTVGCIFKY